MTRQELIEDLIVGDLVKITTENNDVFAGKVLDLGETSIKVELGDTSRIKRISYERIVEYDIVDEDVLREPVIKPVPVVSKTIFAIDREKIFSPDEETLDIRSAHKKCASGLSQDAKKEHSRIQNMVEYAKKVHEFNVKSDRVSRVIAEYKMLAANEARFNVFIALLYFELGLYENANDYFGKANAYDVDFLLLKDKCSDEDLETIAKLAVEQSEENEEIIKWLCSRAVEKKDSGMITFLLDHSKTHDTQILLYWYADKTEAGSIPNKSDIFAKENLEYLKMAFQQKNKPKISFSKSPVKEKNVSSSESKLAPETKSVSEANFTPELKSAPEKDGVYRGEILSYDKDKKYGFIRTQKHGNVYFYIEQVKDSKLQKILLTRSDIEIGVKFKFGINFKGDIAADCIEIDENAVVAGKDFVYEYEGTIDCYSKTTGKGEILTGKGRYSFHKKHIADPVLRAELKSKSQSLFNIRVKFNLKRYTNNSTKKTIENAVDIISKKEYSKADIDKYIEMGYLTQMELDSWMNGFSDLSTIDFVGFTYRTLKPVGSDFEPPKSKVTNTPEPNTPPVSASSAGECEHRAVEIVLANGGPNPFENLPIDNSGKKYYQDAHDAMSGTKDASGVMVGVDLDKAEELFIKAIQSNELVAQSVANLANIYSQRGGDYIVKGLHLLNQYGNWFKAEKLTNMRLQLIDKSGNYEALEQILLSAIPKCTKVNTIWQYMLKLGWSYCKLERWQEAINWLEKSLVYLDKNKSAFPRYMPLRYNNLHSLIVAKYNIGRVEEAVREAKAFIVHSPDDIVIASIANGTYASSTEETGNLDFSELQMENDLTFDDEDDFSTYLRDKIDQVDLSSIFSKISSIYDKLVDGKYTGGFDDVNKAVKHITDNYLKRSGQFRSSFLLGIARILSDSRSMSNTEEGEHSVSFSEVKRYSGRYAKYYADTMIETNKNIDSIRFMYILALIYLLRDDTGNIIPAMNSLIASFFEKESKLQDELHKNYNTYEDSYYKNPIPSAKVRGLLIATFMLRQKPEYVKQILNKVYAEESLRQDFLEKMITMTGKEVSECDRAEFDKIWREAADEYYLCVQYLTNEINASVNEFHMQEKNTSHIANIKNLLDKNMLWAQDRLITDKYIDMLSVINDILEKYSITEKIEGYKEVEQRITRILTMIEEAPTEFTYERIRPCLYNLQKAVRERFDDLYRSSSPDCSVSLSSSSVYVNGNTAQVVIACSNSDNKQNADAVNLDVSVSDGATLIKCEKSFTSIRSGETQEYIAIFNLDENVLEEKQFIVFVEMQYDYKDSVETNFTGEITGTLPVAIADKTSFVPIVNKYDNIIRGSGVANPELFKGRDKIIESICASLLSDDGQLTKNRGIILWGQRRVGKNSVKDYLQARIRRTYGDSYIIIDMGSLGKNHNIQGVLASIVINIRMSLMEEYEDLLDLLYEKDVDFKFHIEKISNSENYMSAFEMFMAEFSTALRAVHKENPELPYIPMLFIDEFSYIYDWIENGELDGHVFMRFWKSFIQDYGVCTIIIGQDNIPVWASKSKNEFDCMNYDNEITFLEYEGARDLVCEPCKMEGRELFSTDAVNLIYELTKGSAFLIVIMCKFIIDYLNANYIETATPTIVQLVFEREFIGKKGMFIPADFEPQIEDGSKVGEEGRKLNAMNFELLKEIARLTISSPMVRIEDLEFFRHYDRDTANSVITRLKERKIIDIEREEYCSINMPLLKLYLLREQSLLTKDVLNRFMR